MIKSINMLIYPYTQLSQAYEYLIITFCIVQSMLDIHSHPLTHSLDKYLCLCDDALYC